MPARSSSVFRARIALFSWQNIRVGGTLFFKVDDLGEPAPRRLIAGHLQGMRASSPAESVHAFDVAQLLGPGVTFWTVWKAGELAGRGALREMDDARGPERFERAPSGTSRSRRNCSRGQTRHGRRTFGPLR
jgi:hypothetical protein